MPDNEDDALREAAAHRGLKLIKSRRRKEGVGDYGRYGLTDGGGKELLGFGADGLTATPADIRDYLRKSEVSTWAQSAEVTPDGPKPVRASPDVPVANDPAPALPSNVVKPPATTQAGVDDHLPRRRGRGLSSSGRQQEAAAAAEGENAAEATPDKPLASKPKAKPTPRPTPEPEPEPKPEPEPVFETRAANKADLEAIGRLIERGIDAVALMVRFDELRRAGGGVLVADRGRVVACLAWQAILNLHEPPIGRVTFLVVEEAERRRGSGTALIAAAAAAMVEQGCGLIEAMSEIELRNVNGFYRAAGFKQKSYRFVRDA